MKRLAQHTAILCGLLLTGCVQFHDKPIDPVQTAMELEVRSLADPGLRSFLESNLRHPVKAWPMQSWDGDTLTLVALYYHPDMDLARAHWGTATAALTTAGESPNPTLNLLPGFDTTTYQPSPWIPFFTIDIPIETAGKRGYRIATAQHNAAAARASILSTAWQVRSRVQRAVLDYVSIDQTIAVLKRQHSSQEEIVRLLELQRPNGNVPPTLVTQARIALRGIRFSVLEAQRSHAEAKAQLAEALGLTVAALEKIQIDRPLSDQLPQTVSSPAARRLAVTSRSDVVAALSDYAASQAALQLEIAKQYPDLHLGPGYQYDQGDNKWTLGITLTLPIFNQNRGAIAEAEGHRTETAARFIALQAKVLNDIDRAVLVYEAAIQKVEAARELMIDVQKQRKATEAAFNVGEISRLELIGVQLELQTNEQASLEAIIKAHQSLLAVEDALQRPLGIPEAGLIESPRRPQPSQEKQSK